MSFEIEFLALLRKGRKARNLKGSKCHSLLESQVIGKEEAACAQWFVCSNMFSNVQVRSGWNLGEWGGWAQTVLDSALLRGDSFPLRFPAEEEKREHSGES